MNSDVQSSLPSAYSARLDKTVKELQERVKEQEAALKRVLLLSIIRDTKTNYRKLQKSSVNFSSQPSQDPQTRLQQIHTFNAAFQSLTPKEPYLPPIDSPLPALLAHRKILQNVSHSKAGIASVEHESKEAQKQADKERSDLSDAKLIYKALDERIQVLRTEIKERTQRSPSQTARDMIRELQRKKKRYDQETVDLVKSFNAFIDDILAPMLAAEELGGPVVGEMPEVGESELGHGFSSQGKVKKSKNIPDEDKRQRRIDQIWGPAPQEGSFRTDKDEWTEQKAAGVEMRDLTEQLLNNLVESDGLDVYVRLGRESAAARFLVRSKVAQFHPRDATKLRLIDFGKELDD